MCWTSSTELPSLSTYLLHKSRFWFYISMTNDAFLISLSFMLFISSLVQLETSLESFNSSYKNLMEIFIYWNNLINYSKLIFNNLLIHSFHRIKIYDMSYVGHSESLNNSNLETTGSTLNFWKILIYLYITIFDFNMYPYPRDFEV